MSLTLRLYTNVSDTNVVSKSITQLSELTGTLKEATSILRPVIKVTGTIPTNCNYFKIDDFNRYYFIDDVVSIHNELYEISGHVDVLMTYADEIRQCSGIVARQEEKYNLYLDDGSFKVYNNPYFQMKTFPNGFDSLHFVLAVAGNS